MHTVLDELLKKGEKKIEEKRIIILWQGVY